MQKGSKGRSLHRGLFHTRQGERIEKPSEGGKRRCPCSKRYRCRRTAARGHIFQTRCKLGGGAVVAVAGTSTALRRVYVAAAAAACCRSLEKPTPRSLPPRGLPKQKPFRSSPQHRHLRRHPGSTGTLRFPIGTRAIIFLPLCPLERCGKREREREGGFFFFFGPAPGPDATPPLAPAGANQRPDGSWSKEEGSKKDAL